MIEYFQIEYGLTLFNNQPLLKVKSSNKLKEIYLPSELCHQLYDPSVILESESKKRLSYLKEKEYKIK